MFLPPVSIGQKSSILSNRLLPLLLPLFAFTVVCNLLVFVQAKFRKQRAVAFSMCTLYRQFTPVFFTMNCLSDSSLTHPEPVCSLVYFMDIEGPVLHSYRHCGLYTTCICVGPSLAQKKQWLSACACCTGNKPLKFTPVCLQRTARANVHSRTRDPSVFVCLRVYGRRRTCFGWFMWTAAPVKPCSGARETLPIFSLPKPSKFLNLSYYFYAQNL